MTTPEQIWPDQHLVDDVPGWSVRVVASTGSTNADLLHAATTGAPDRSVLVAAHQTAGRGRLDRRWEAPPGANLLVSVLRRGIDGPPISAVTRLALAVREACAEVAGVTPSLKWPNDLLVGDRKLGGILSQLAPDGSVVVGLGVNVGWAPDGAAALVREAPEGSTGITPMRLLRAMLLASDRLPADLRHPYRDALGTLGRRVRVDLPDGSVLEGTAIDVDDAGRLGLLDGCGMTHRLDVGDVVHLRTA